MRVPSCRDSTHTGPKGVLEAARLEQTEGGSKWLEMKAVGWSVIVVNVGGGRNSGDAHMHTYTYTP